MERGLTRTAASRASSSVTRFSASSRFCGRREEVLPSAGEVGLGTHALNRTDGGEGSPPIECATLGAPLERR